MNPALAADDPRYVKALSHPLRVRIMAILEERTASPVQLATALDASLGMTSYHVQVLLRLELIELVREESRRGAVEHHYRAKARERPSADAWDRAAPVAKQALLGAALQQIHEYAAASAAAGGFDRGDAHLTRTHVTVDEEGWAELADALARLLGDIERIERASEQRREREGRSAEIRAATVNMLFRVRPSDGDERDAA